MPTGSHLRRIMTGESVMGQHAPNAHFGLGGATKVDAIEVRWINGTTWILDAPATGRYHRARPPVDRPR
ncbi:MAG: ASPIC/UnbV domain-containing protein [Deltaproteobacteria bacterium]|nr:ASPIC/UnbV domain-containing protein [Deltaproteobacteria bacterium]